MNIVTLYGPDFSYFLRVTAILCRYKGLPYQVTLAPYGDVIPPFGEGHKALHPYKRMPVLIEGDLVLPESLAIAYYINTKEGPNFLPQSAGSTAGCLSLANQIALYTHEALMKNLILEFAFPKGPDKTIRFEWINNHLNDAKSSLLWLEQTIADSDYLYSNSFTVADAYLIPMLDYLDQMPEQYRLIQEYAGLQQYLSFHRQQSYCQMVLGPGKPQQ